MEDIAGLPLWIPQEDWDGWVKMRKAIKKPMTQRAMMMAQKKLLELLHQGQDVGLVLQQSEFNNWTDLYPVRAETGQQAQQVHRGPPRLTLVDQQRISNEEAKRILGFDDNGVIDAD